MIDFARDDDDTDERPAPLTEEQQKLFDAHIGHVERLAQKRANHFIGYDDQLQQGLIGLLDAARRFEPDRGLKFWTFAARRVLGEMQEAGRAGWADVIRVPRSANMTGAEKSRLFGTRFEALVERQTRFLGDDRTTEPKELAAPSNEPVVDAETLWLAASRLGKRESLIVLMYYRMNKTMREISESIGLSESRVSQMHSDALERLRDNPRVLEAVG